MISRILCVIGRILFVMLLYIPFAIKFGFRKTSKDAKEFILNGYSLQDIDNNNKPQIRHFGLNYVEKYHYIVDNGVYPAIRYEFIDGELQNDDGRNFIKNKKFQIKRYYHLSRLFIKQNEILDFNQFCRKYDNDHPKIY